MTINPNSILMHLPSAHELGHALGLDHALAPESLMHLWSSQTGLHPCQIEAASHIFGGAPK